MRLSLLLLCPIHIHTPREKTAIPLHHLFRLAVLGVQQERNNPLDVAAPAFLALMIHLTLKPLVPHPLLSSMSETEYVEDDASTDTETVFVVEFSEYLGPHYHRFGVFTSEEQAHRAVSQIDTEGVGSYDEDRIFIREEQLNEFQPPV